MRMDRSERMHHAWLRKVSRRPPAARGNAPEERAPQPIGPTHEPNHKHPTNSSVASFGHPPIRARGPGRRPARPDGDVLRELASDRHALAFIAAHIAGTAGIYKSFVPRIEVEPPGVSTYVCPVDGKHPWSRPVLVLFVLSSAAYEPFGDIVVRVLAGS
jgi:hypothetical protein